MKKSFHLHAVGCFVLMSLTESIIDHSPFLLSFLKSPFFVVAVQGPNNSFEPHARTGHAQTSRNQSFYLQTSS